MCRNIYNGLYGSLSLLLIRIIFEFYAYLEMGSL